MQDFPNTGQQKNELKTERLEPKKEEISFNSKIIENKKKENANDLAIYIVKALKYLFEE